MNTPNARRLLLPASLLLLALLQACATASPPCPPVQPPRIPSPPTSIAKPVSPESFSERAQTNISEWQRRLTNSEMSPSGSKPGPVK